MSPYYFVKILENFTKNFELRISMMKRLSEGGTLTPDELKFILLTKQMSEKANRQNKSNPLGGLLEGLKPVLPLVGSLLEL